MVFAVLGPLMVFRPKLAAAKREGLREYGTLAQRYAREFDHKWLRGGAPADEPLIGSADIQSLADLGNSFEVVTGMRLVPFTMRTVVQLAVVTLLPVVPLLLTMIPLKELLERLASGRPVPPASTCRAAMAIGDGIEEALPDLRDEDIAGSGFAITGYTTHERLGGDAALARLRDRLRARGLRLMLDFVPNHTGLDHPWVDSHPDYYIPGTVADLEREPQNYTRVEARAATSSWHTAATRTSRAGRTRCNSTTAIRDHKTRCIAELVKISGQCDGVRCDMAMLVLPDVFERTWGRRPQPFWPRATREVRERVPGFCFMAEVYWDLEWTLQQQGFDYAYDKRLYDRLRERQPGRSASISTPGSTFRTSWPGFWKTTTNRGRRRPSLRTCTRLRRSSRFCRPACGSSTRDSWTAGRSASRHTWFAHRTRSQTKC